MAGRPPKISRRTLLTYFKTMEHDATNYRLLVQDKPWVSLLASGEITENNITQALTRAVQAGDLERRGYRKGAVYRITEKGLKYLKDNS